MITYRNSRPAGAENNLSATEIDENFKHLDDNKVQKVAGKGLSSNDFTANHIGAIQSIDSKVDDSLLAQPNGVATLGADGKVPVSQLPRKVFFEFNFPITGALEQSTVISNESVGVFGHPALANIASFEIKRNTLVIPEGQPVGSLEVGNTLTVSIVRLDSAYASTITLNS